MAKARPQGHVGQKTAVGVVTQDSLVPALAQKPEAPRAHVNSLENITAESCRGEKQSDIAYHGKSFVIGNTVLEVNNDY